MTVSHGGPSSQNKRGLSASSRSHTADPEFNRLVRTALDLFRRPSPSGEEDLVRAYVVASLSRSGFQVVVDQYGNVLAQRGTPATQEGIPLLSFHMDQIIADWSDWSITEPWPSEPFAWREDPWFQEPSQRSTRSTSKKKARGERKRGRPIGTSVPSMLPASAVSREHGRIHTSGRHVLGGDDKCGGAIALTLARFLPADLPLKIVASVEEETGCWGIRKVARAFLQDVCYALVLDRRHNDDLITHIGSSSLCSPEFALQMVQAAQRVDLTVRPTEGALSDALTLSGTITNVVNVSVGYYRPHSVQEFVVEQDLFNAYRWIKEAVETMPRQIPTAPRPPVPRRGSLERTTPIIVTSLPEWLVLCPLCAGMLDGFQSPAFPQVPVCSCESLDLEAADMLDEWLAAWERMLDLDERRTRKRSVVKESVPVTPSSRGENGAPADTEQSATLLARAGNVLQTPGPFIRWLNVQPGRTFTADPFCVFLREHDLLDEELFNRGASVLIQFENTRGGLHVSLWEWSQKDWWKQLREKETITSYDALQTLRVAGLLRNHDLETFPDASISRSQVQSPELFHSEGTPLRTDATGGYEFPSEYEVQRDEAHE